MTKKKIIVFMPAHNEEENISGVIARVPTEQILRRWIYDCQSGMRGFSRDAMENAPLFMTITTPRC